MTRETEKKFIRPTIPSLEHKADVRRSSQTPLVEGSGAETANSKNGGCRTTRIA